MVCGNLFYFYTRAGVKMFYKVVENLHRVDFCSDENAELMISRNVQIKVGKNGVWSDIVISLGGLEKC